jgi:hypothetical protein
MTAELRSLSVMQPWAYAITHAGKRVENRAWGTGYRGLLAIHAGKTDDEDGWHAPVIQQALAHLALSKPVGSDLGAVPRGAVVAVATVVACHLANGDCCPPWGVHGQHHILLADVRPLAEPVPMRGALGIPPVPADLIPTILERAA